MGEPEVEAGVESVAAAGIGEFFDHIAAATTVGCIPDMVLCCLTRPHAKAATVCQHKDNLFSTEGFRRLTPFIHV